MTSANSKCPLWWTTRVIDARRLTTLSAFAHIFFHFFFSPLRGANISPTVPGPFRQERLRISLRDSAHKSLSQSGKGRSDLANDCSTLLDEVWNRPPHKRSAACHCSQPSVWHDRYKASDQGRSNKGSLFGSPAQHNLGSRFIAARDKCR